MMKYLWFALFFVVLVWSAINPKDQFIWFLEVVPALIGGIVALLLFSRYHDKQLKEKR